MLRSLTHYWRINTAVVIGAAVATAVLTGAIIVGDSMRASLRQLTLDRLGGIDAALLSDELFREQLAGDLEDALQREEPGARAAPALMLEASATNADTRALASGVTLLGIDARFSAMFPELGHLLAAGLERAAGQLFPPVVINRSLARELGAEVGDAVLLSFEAATEIPRESLLGTQSTVEALAGQRLTVTAVVADRGPGRFGVTPHQQTTYNAFVRLDDLQRRLDRPQQANALFAGSGKADVILGTDALQRALASELQLADLGLEIVQVDDVTRLSSRRFVLRDHTVDRALELFSAAEVPAQPLLGYLANELTVGQRSIPYSMIVGVDAPLPSALGRLVTASGTDLSSIGDDEVVLGQWAAEELEADVGDRLRLTYFTVGANDSLETTFDDLEIVAIAEMEGLLVDPALLPDFPGIADADDIAAWEPPFPMDLGLIRTADEEFWDRYGAAPKAITNLATAQRLWANRFGEVTTVRAAASAGADLEAQMVSRLDPTAFGLDFQPIKAQGLEAAAGATDFAGLFIGFSIFLIGSAALVVGLLFSLSVDLRAAEVGLRRAVGYPEPRVRRRLLAEGLLLATVGGTVGAGLAIGYAALLINLLAELWKPMLDLPLLLLDLQPVSVAASVIGSIGLVVVTIVLSLRRLRRVPTPSLLAGVTRTTTGGRRALGGPVAVIALGLAAAAIVGAIVSGSRTSPALFFSAGALLIVAGFGAFSAWCRRPQGRLRGAGTSGYIRMAARNSAHNPGRSLLAVALVGCASFMLVSIAANRRELDPRALGRESGTGGYTLVAETDAPLRGEIDDLRVSPTAETYPLRLLPGEDASCLNLYQPEKPRVVGVPAAFVERGGFSFSATAAAVDNPWTLLERPIGNDVIPAIGDANSVRWILHSGLGQDISLVDDHGETVHLRLVGLLDKSIFQSELMISEEAFLRHFPAHGGYSYFLFDTPLENRDEVGSALETELASYGLDATATADKLARFLGIEEMYLSTFQLLGGLGLILGTVGLGVVLMRNVHERRSELAMLRAFGFERRSIARMILLENAFQLAVGLVIGSAAGLLALLPHFLDASLHLPWKSLAATFGTVILVGMLSSVVGVVAALRSPLLPALKAD